MERGYCTFSGMLRSVFTFVFVVNHGFLYWIGQVGSYIFVFSVLYSFFNHHSPYSLYFS